MGAKITEFVFKIRVPDWLERILVVPLLAYRRLRYGYPFRRIPLTRGKFAIVDPEDYYRLSKYKWIAFKGRKTFYATRRTRNAETRCSTMTWMHRVILNAPEGFLVDHINHNGLDNRKANLRLVTPTQNMWNRKKTNKKTSSKYKGVSYNKDHKKWNSVIVTNGKYRNLGYFTSEFEAAKTYDRAARKYFGKLALTNFDSE